MKIRNARLALLPFVLAFAFGCGGNSAGIDGGIVGTRGGGSTPILASPATADGGTVVTWTLNLDAPSANGETFTVTSSPAGSFTSIPSSVTVPSGQSSVTFNTTLANSANGDVTVTATSSARVRVGHVTARAMWGN